MTKTRVPYHRVIDTLKPQKTRARGKEEPVSIFHHKSCAQAYHMVTLPAKGVVSSLETRREDHASCHTVPGLATNCVQSHWAWQTRSMWEPKEYQSALPSRLLRSPDAFQDWTAARQGYCQTREAPQLVWKDDAAWNGPCRRILHAYVTWYNQSRVHQSIGSSPLERLESSLARLKEGVNNTWKMYKFIWGNAFFLKRIFCV